MKEFIDFYETNKSNKVHLLDIDSVKFIVKEITWKEGLLIDAKSFRKKDNILYQNTEFEKREILSIAILRAYDTNTETDYIPDYNIPLIQKIDHSTVEKLCDDPILISLVEVPVVITNSQ